MQFWTAIELKTKSQTYSQILEGDWVHFYHAMGVVRYFLFAMILIALCGVVLYCHNNELHDNLTTISQSMHSPPG